ncbi:hypothetical protein [Rhodopseudomonas palustris]|uniref:hypothetical protein n=1 Tax=Rhodopseudomonas palustris TaxID=1076 RepID=UPI0003023ABE|nr:hypothetical protein [Rhodopseudomonas palustris]
MATKDNNGSVYVFNVFSETLTLSTNGVTVKDGDIPGWFTDASPKYRPNAVAVPRVLNASEGPGKFFNGTNRLTIQWADGLFGASVAIDGAAFPLIQDLLLFIDRNKWQLVNEYGVEKDTGQVIGAAALGELARGLVKA